MSPLKTPAITSRQKSARAERIVAWTVTAAFLFCFAHAMATLVSVWRHSYIYSYGFLIPCVSAYLLWTERKNLRIVMIEPAYLPGIPVLFAGVALLVAGTKTGNASLQGIALVVALSGMVLILRGQRYFAAAWLPIAYLLFMVPFWDNLTEHLHHPLQIFSAVMGTAGLELAGIPINREGVVLTLPSVTLKVARECSGVNNLIAVVALAIPLSYVVLTNWISRIILVCAGIAIAIVGNGVRVALIGVLAYFGAAGDFHGPYHLLQAMTVSFIGFSGVFVCAIFLARRQGPGDRPRPLAETPAHAPVRAEKQGNDALLQLFVPLVLLLTAGVYVNFVSAQ